MTLIDDWTEIKKVNKAIDHLVECAVAIPTIKTALAHVTKVGGKRTRPTIALISSELCGGDHDEVMNFALAVELIHTASLVHDDVIDDGMRRRNVETVHLKYGIPVAILLGDWLISKAVELVSVYDEDVISDFARLGMMMAEGEVLDIHSIREKADEKDYLKCISSKTAAMFTYSAENACKIVSPDKQAACSLFDYGKHLGIAFQLVDDLLEFLELFEDKKSDIQSRTLPMIYEEIYGFEESVRKVFNLIQRHASASKKAIEYFELCESREKLSKLADYMTANLLRSYANEKREILKLFSKIHQAHSGRLTEGT